MSKHLHQENDPLGTAAFEFLKTGKKTDILVESDIAEDDVIPVSHLFRSFDEMPKLEQFALEHCRGKVLDVGAGTGCHSLVLQERHVEVDALEISELLCQVMQERGVKNVIHANFYSHRGNYDVLLLMMNGIGLAGSIRGLEEFLDQAHALLKPGGQIIFDSSDIEYIYHDDEGSFLYNLNSNYYGELQYRMRYGKICGAYFPWLFIDFETLIPIAEKKGFVPTLLAEGEHYDYLGMLKKMT